MTDERTEDRAGNEAGAEERHETEAQRIDRNLTELLQELRVAGIGVQVLFGFLLSLPFANRFGVLSAAQRRLYFVDLLCTALAAALLSAPVAYHRLVFRQHKKRGLLKAANWLAIGGLSAVALAVSGAVLLAVSVVYRGVVAPVAAALTAAVFIGLWFVMPLFDKRDSY